MSAATRRRRVDGLLLLDKPTGPSSNAVLQRVKWLYRAEKAGHTGSLDPLASGLLPLCFGSATRLGSLMLAGDKGYRVRARLGETRVGGDATGELLVRTPVPELHAALIEAALAPLRGDILQRPPMYSALKHQGRPLYELARAGIEIERGVRPVTIHRLAVLAIEDGDVELAVDCSKGTYIRSLVEDFGAALGCGAHVLSLRRTWSAPFREPQMVAMDTIEGLAGDLPALDALLLPPAAMLAGLPRAQLDPAAAIRFCHGNPVPYQGPVAETLAVFEGDGNLLGIARGDGEMLWPGKVLV